MDFIQTELPPLDPTTGRRMEPSRMVVVPFTGVGPRMYEDYFLKRGELKEKIGIGLRLGKPLRTPSDYARQRRSKRQQLS